jgi:hypothetical protein
MTHAAVNELFLTLALLLECGLLALLLARGIARRLPVFSTLLAFYLLRSTLLFSIFGHIDSASYASIVESLSIVDLLLQSLVAIEIAGDLSPANGASAYRPRAILMLPPIVALLATWLLASILPVNSPVPFDRAQTFDWLWLMILGCCSIAARQASPPSRRVAVGFALYAAAVVICWMLALNRTAPDAEEAHARWLSSRSAAETSVSS